MEVVVIAAHRTVRGTHRGEYQGIPATAKPISQSGITSHHLKGGKICETWLSFDSAVLPQQIGAVPAAAKA
jgi:predicted ester cyclase